MRRWHYRIKIHSNRLDEFEAWSANQGIKVWIEDSHRDRTGHWTYKLFRVRCPDKQRQMLFKLTWGGNG